MYLHISCFVSSLHCPSPLILSLHCHCMNYMGPTHVHYITSVSFLVSLGVSAGWGQECNNDWWPNVSLFSLHQGPRLAPVWSVNPRQGLARSQYQDITVTAHQMYLLSTRYIYSSLGLMVPLRDNAAACTLFSLFILSQFEVSWSSI